MSDYEGWAIVELMGHRRRAGRVTEVESYGAKLLRLDVPTADGEEITDYYGGAAIYCRVCGDSGEPFHRPGLTPWAEPDLCAICAVYHEGAG